ncbi:MAG: succinyldiaminopimelate transaminase [Acidithiobacillales bacterium SG8_45]|jgi:N-succinyldiaminopimelate aminotransferase|nr:MAG: succinyldiaminopimelate transaminase [Acidithiobacillales bacterium SG8_45]
MNPRLALLHDYPFQKLARLFADLEAPADKSPIKWSVGEPKHPAPEIVLAAIRENLNQLSTYPSTRGLPELRQAISAWLVKRFALAPESLDPERHVLPVSGTREALFSAAQAVVDNTAAQKPVVIMPNPFYQIYEGAALLAGAEPYYLNTTTENSYRMDFSGVPTDILDRTALVYVCSPGNPAGAVLGANDYRAILELAEKHDFIVASDECYSEIYFDEANPPTGLLQVASDLGIADYRRCLVFHSLSKRSNLPGLRSGFVAGDGDVMASYLKYRTYHGATISNTAQLASIVAWIDETHVAENRAQYRAKFDAVLEILGPVMGATRPDAGFYLWPKVDISDEDFARGLYAGENVTVLPGSYLSRDAQGINPGSQHVRMALVAPLDECVEAAHRVKHYCEQIS